MDKSIIERVIEVRTDCCGPRGRAAFASRIGISPSTYSYYERDRIPDAELLLKIADVAGVSLEWLIAGRGPKYRLPSSDPGAGQPIGAAHVVSALNSLLAARPELGGAVGAFLQVLSQVAQFPAKAQAETSAAAVPSVAAPEMIPVVGRTAAGKAHFWRELPGDFDPQQHDRRIESLLFAAQQAPRHPAALESPLDLASSDRRCALVQLSAPDDDGIVEFLACAAVKRRYPDAVAWRIDGDSMAPRFHEGDLVIGSAQQPAQPGQPCIARLKGQIGVTCKMYDRRGDDVVLSPLNRAYEPSRVAAGDLEWAVAVIASVRLASSQNSS